MLAGILFALYEGIPPPYRPYAVGLFAVAVGVGVWRERRKRSDRKPVAVVEIIAREIRLANERGNAAFPWSAFGKIGESDTLFVLPDRSGFQLYVFPKRAFPNQQSCDWFRELAVKASEITAASAESPQPFMPVAAPAMEPGAVALQFRLRYRDYMDRAIASWFTLGFMIFTGTLMLGAFIFAGRNPPPNPVFSATQVVLFFGIPIMLVLELVILLVAATHAWLQHRRYLVQQAVTISERGVSYLAADGRSTIDWESPTRYKETPWSFIIWWPGTQHWMQLPKRAFPTVDGTARCREILAQHAKSPTWYFA